MLVYNERNRVAVEFFHAVTDGNGGMTFFKTLLAEYISQKYGVAVPTEHGVLGRLEEPDEEELEDSFLRYAGDVKASRKEATAYHLTGTPEPDGFKNLITMIAPSDDVRAAAKRHGVTVTERVPQRRLRKPVKVLLPVNLRRMFPSKTLRNFVSYITPEIDPCMGDYSFDEICSIVHHRMGLENNPQSMRAKFAACPISGWYSCQPRWHRMSCGWISSSAYRQRRRTTAAWSRGTGRCISTASATSAKRSLRYGFIRC